MTKRHRRHSSAKKREIFEAYLTGDVWVGFRYRSTANSAHIINVDGSFLEFQ